MNILIIAPGYAPIPAAKGGAIEGLVETYLKYNEIAIVRNNVVVYSANLTNEKIDTSNYNYTEFRYIDYKKNKLRAFIRKVQHKLTHRYIEYDYINSVIIDLIKKNELEKYDVVIVENISQFGKIVRKYLKTSKIILHLHNDYLNIETKNKEELVNSFDEIWCVSNFIASRVKAIGNSDKKKVKVLHNGIEIKRFNEDIQNKDIIIELKKKYGIKDKDFIFLYTGRLMPEKGIKELIESYIEILPEIEESKLIVTGGIRNSDKNRNKFLDELMEKAKQYSEKIVFTGNIAYNDLPSIYKLADVQIVPSIWNEAFGLTVTEGMASGKALIVSDAGAIPEVVGDNSAIIVNRNNLKKELAENMKKLYGNKSLREYLIKNAKERVKEFDAYKYYENFEKFLKEEE